MARKKTKNTLTYETLSALFTGICDAIRSKTGEVGLINHQDIPDVIANLPSGGAINVEQMPFNATTQYQTSNQDFIAPESGIYFIFATYSGSTSMTLDIRVNNVAPSPCGKFNIPIGSNNTARLTVLHLNKNDSVYQRYNFSVLCTYTYIKD